MTCPDPGVCLFHRMLSEQQPQNTMLYLPYHIRLFFTAVQFFTRIPLPERLAAWVGFDSGMQRDCVVYFPLMGLLVAVCTASPLLLLSASPYVAAVLAVAVGVWLTGGLHEDGLADVADGMGGGANCARCLEIMKDSRTGSFGVLALVLVLVARISILAALLQQSVSQAVYTFVLAHVLSRACALVVMRVLPYVDYSVVDVSSRSQALTANYSTTRLLLAWLLPTALLLAGWLYVLQWQQTVAALLLPLVAVAYLVGLFRRRLGGFNGDCLGAVQQLCEVACLFAVLYLSIPVPL